MIPSVTINLLRALFVIFACFIGSAVGDTMMGSHFVGFAAGLAFGLMIVLADRLLKGFTLRMFSSATFGLLLGLISARLLLSSNILKYQSEETSWLIQLIVFAVFGYLGMMLAIRSNRDEFSIIIPYVRFQRSGLEETPLLIDTNIIIDGRLPALCETGFVSRSVVVPRFILDELQRLADSHDSLKRERGKRGLDSLQEMQQNPRLSVTIHDSETDTETPVDTKLVELARLLQARLLSNDSNLCKIARLQGVAILNLNDLANVLRHGLSTGDEIDLALVKEGRDAHQAVGYLPDGTMIVVNNARPRVGETVRVTISSAVQTAAGRLFFADVKRL